MVKPEYELLHINTKFLNTVWQSKFITQKNDLVNSYNDESSHDNNKNAFELTGHGK